MDVLGYFASYELQANLLRRSGSAHPVAQLLEAVRASAQHGVAFTHAISVDGTESKVEDTAAWWRRELARGDHAQQHFGGLVLTTGESDASVNALYNREPYGPVPYDRVRVDFPAGSLGGTDGLARWLSAVALAYEADLAWVHTRDLLGLVRGARGPAEEAPSWWATLPPELTRTFAALKEPAAFDVCDTPEAVWWINIWNSSILRRLGAASRNATWARSEALPGDRELFIASVEPPDRNHPRALEHIAMLTRTLDLARLQRADRG